MIMAITPEQRMLVKDIATMHALSVQTDARIIDVARMMRDSCVGIIPVVKGDHPVGIITDRDIVTRVVAENSDWDCEVANVMTPYAVSISSDADIHQAEQRMSQFRIRRLLVVNTEGKLVGVLSIDDLAFQNIDAQRLSQIICESLCGMDTEPSSLS